MGVIKTRANRVSYEVRTHWAIIDNALVGIVGEIFRAKGVLILLLLGLRVGHE